MNDLNVISKAVLEGKAKGTDRNRLSGLLRKSLLTEELE